jgi:hypothetical protein
MSPAPTERAEELIALPLSRVLDAMGRGIDPTALDRRDDTHTETEEDR